MPKESGHWYNDDGILVEKVPNAKGDKQITPDIRHARKLGLLPSTTTVLKGKASHGLVSWQIEHAVRQAWGQPPTADEPEEDYICRIVEMAGDYARSCAKQGTEIHGDIERYLKTGKEPFNPVSERAAKAIAERVEDPKCEIAFGNRERGWAGTADIVTPRSVIDIKTVTDLKKKRKPYYRYGLQLASYRMGLELPADIQLVNVLVSRETGDVQWATWGEDTKHTHKQLCEAWLYLFSEWTIEHCYDPRTP